jgi:carbon-monoxide dehydrogenase large subunit
MKLATTIIGKATEDIIQKGRKIASFLLDTGEIDLENSYYALQSAQLLAGSFMDYAMPRADTLPLLATALSEIPAPSNRLGVRSGGEGVRHRHWLW